MEQSVLEFAWRLRDFLEQEHYFSFLLPEVDRWLKEYKATSSEKRDEILKNHINSLKESPYFLEDTLLAM